MFKSLKSHWPALVISVAVLLAFYPSLIQGKIPLNARNLVSFFSPWTYQQWAGFPAGVPAKPGILDQLRIYYPYMRLTQSSYRQGQIPLWNPHNFTGNPHMAEWQSGVFYPLHILLLFLPLPIYWTLYQMSAFFLAALFTYLYLKNLKIHRYAAVFAGLTYAFSSYMYTWNAEVVTAPHSILWLPAMLLLVDKFLYRPQMKTWLLLILSGVLSVLSGYWQTTFYAFGFTFFYILFRSFNLKKTTLLLLSVFPFIAALTSFHLLPTAQLYQRSSRSLVNLSDEILTKHKGYLLDLHRLITLIAPDFFGNPTTRNNFSTSDGSFYEWSIFIGTVPIILLMFLYLIPPHRKKLTWFYIIIALTAGSLSFNLPHSRWVFDNHIPVISTGIANRILYIPAFALSILSALALNAWLKAKRSSQMTAVVRLILIIAAILILLWVFLFYLGPNLKVDSSHFPDNWLTIAKRNSILPSLTLVSVAAAFFLGLKKRKYLLLTAAAVITISLLQNIYQFNKFTPFSESRFVYPGHSTIEYLQKNAGINRYLGYNGVYLNYNFATQYGLYAVEGYDSLNDFSRSRFLLAAQYGGVLPNTVHRSADLVVSRDLSKPTVLKMMQLTGIKYLVDYPKFPDAVDKASQPVLADNKQKLVFQDGDWKIYQYLDALPRAFLVGSYQVAETDQAIASAVYDPNTDLRNTVILDAPPADINPSPDLRATVTVTTYTANKITFNTDAKTDQLLFLSDTYYPGWKAKVDGQPAPVLRANYAFRAVPVPAGSHSVKMYYLPESFTIGLWISVGALTLIFIITRKINCRHLVQKTG